MFKKILKKTAVTFLGIVTAVNSLLSGGCSMPGTVRAEGYYDYMSLESLKEVYADKFRLGVAVQAISHWGDTTAEIGNAFKEEFIDEQFNSMTFGNEFKPAYNFDPNVEGLFTVDRAAEELLDWAKEHDMPVRGHCLVWHSQVDPSIFARDFKATSNGSVTRDYNVTLDEDCLVDRDTLLARLKTYIYSVMEYTYANGYAETIYAWDVVNEAVEENQDDGLRRSYWYKIIGPDFLYFSFLYAREAEEKFAPMYAEQYGLDPDGDLSSIKPELYYNDYNEWFPAKVDAIIDVLTVRQFNEGHRVVQSPVINPDGDGTIYGDGLIDGIGLQGHLTATDSLTQYAAALEKYAAAINNLQVTELDVGKHTPGDAGDYRQARFYYDYFTMLLDAVDSGININSVTLWGLTDTSSWRKETEPLLFNTDLSPKSAYYAVVMAGMREEFDMVDYSIRGRAEDLFLDFEPVQVNGSWSNKTPSELGFVSRGAGHQATVMLKMKENHTPDAATGFALQVRRDAVDATLRYDISRFIGHAITISYYIKSEDQILTMGIEGFEDAGSVSFDTPEFDWTLVETTVRLPENLDSAGLYFETEGSGEFLIDDFEIRMCDDVQMADGFEGGGTDAADTAPDADAAATVDQPATDTEGQGFQVHQAIGIAVMLAAISVIVLGVVLGRLKESETGKVEAKRSEVKKTEEKKTESGKEDKDVKEQPEEKNKSNNMNNKNGKNGKNSKKKKKK
ncbi:MAG: endo-1,4-beta-xylanase [Lachnospiraceae bacterium]|nr:endo-1,4-beta-xylanase [Lachnospiraceae bacterium]